MADSIVQSNFVRFDSNGLELVVDTSTGLVYASISAIARMLETPRQTIQDAITKGAGKYNIANAQVQTPGGIQGCRIVSALVVFKLAIKYHPLLAEAMGSAGANVYMLGLAGYKVTVEPELPTDMLGWMKLAVASEEAKVVAENARLALAAKIEADAPLVEYATAVQHSDTSIDFNAFAKMIGTGRTRLFRAMREAGVIMKNTTLPYQKFVEGGYFEISQEVTEDGKLIPFALVTGKGQIWLKQRLFQSIDTQQKMIAAISGGVAQMSLL